MARIKRGMTKHAHHKKIVKLAKGYFGARSKLYKTAHASVMHALRHEYIGRRLRKRDFRRLWISRINAASRQNGLSYSRLINGLKLAGITINRKMLSDIAVHDTVAFAQLVDIAKDKCRA